MSNRLRKKQGTNKAQQALRELKGEGITYKQMAEELNIPANSLRHFMIDYHNLSQERVYRIIEYGEERLAVIKRKRQEYYDSL